MQGARLEEEAEEGQVTEYGGEGTRIFGKHERDRMKIQHLVPILISKGASPENTMLP